MKRPAYTISTLLICAAFVAALFVWPPSRAQVAKPTAAPAQYAIVCAADDFVSEVKKANEKGLVVDMSACKVVGEKIVCLANEATSEEDAEGR